MASTGYVPTNIGYTYAQQTIARGIGADACIHGVFDFRALPYTEARNFFLIAMVCSNADRRNINLATTPIHIDGNNTQNQPTAHTLIIKKMFEVDRHWYLVDRSIGFAFCSE